MPDGRLIRGTAGDSPLTDARVGRAEATRCGKVGEREEPAEDARRLHVLALSGFGLGPSSMILIT